MPSPFENPATGQIETLAFESLASSRAQLARLRWQEGDKVAGLGLPGLMAWRLLSFNTSDSGQMAIFFNVLRHAMELDRPSLREGKTRFAVEAMLAKGLVSQHHRASEALGKVRAVLRDIDEGERQLGATLLMRHPQHWLTGDDIDQLHAHSLLAPAFDAAASTHHAKLRLQFLLRRKEAPLHFFHPQDNPPALIRWSCLTGHEPRLIAPPLATYLSQHPGCAWWPDVVQACPDVIKQWILHSVHDDAQVLLNAVFPLLHPEEISSWCNDMEFLSHNITSPHLPQVRTVWQQLQLDRHSSANLIGSIRPRL